MEANAKLGSEEAKTNNTNNEQEQQREEHQENHNLPPAIEGENEGSQIAPAPLSSRRPPFTHLSQVDFDFALARTLQEQERAYMMLKMNNDASDYGSWERGSYLHDHYHDDDDDEDDFGDPDDDENDEEDEYNDDDVDAFDAAHTHADSGDDNLDHPEVEIDPTSFSSDEAYARALQDAEEREMAARLLALSGIDDREAEDDEDSGDNSQDIWEEVNPDELLYEELLALGEVVGTETRGLPADTIASLPSINYKSGSNENGSNDSCVICRLDYEDGENLTLLSCKHSYHSDCINNWLKINKVCPVCSSEVSTSGNS